METTTDWYRLATPDDVDSPALLVYPDRIQYNIALLTSNIDDPTRLRPHVKTHKTREITRLQLEAGIRKFKCATIAEADMLGECGAPDVLLAYPLQGPKLQRFAALAQAYPHTNYAALVDNNHSAAALSAMAVRKQLHIAVYIDLNIGMGRTGISPGEEALELYQLCDRLDGLDVRGFHAYDGPVRDVDLAKRKALCDHNFAPITVLSNKLLQEGFPKPEIIIGGSPSFPIYARYPEVECSPGTFVLWDKGYGDSLPEQPFLPAAVLLTRVVSLPSATHICVDLGYKAVASENPLSQRLHFLHAPQLQPLSHSEEHLVLDAGEGHTFQVGDVLYALPTHICPTVALYDKLQVVRHQAVVAHWEVVARKR